MKDAWNPQQYDKFKNERSQPFFDLLNLVEKTKNPVVVDLGCGTGELTKVLHEKINARSTLGLDNSDKMLEKAKHLSSEKLKFGSRDIQKFCEPQSYDLIFSNAALQWCSHHLALFANLRKSLKKGGQLAIQMPMNHDYPTHTIAKAVAQKEPFKALLKISEADQKNSTLLKPEEYASLLFDLGFKNQKVMLRVYSHVLDSRDDVIDWVKGTTLTYYQSQLPEDVYEKFLSQYRVALFKVLPDQKPFFYPFKRVLIWGSL